MAVHVVLDNVRSAYNVGSIFRTSDAGQVTELHLCGLTAHPPHEKLDKTALGACDHVPWSYHREAVRAVEALAERGIPAVAVETAPGAVSYLEYPWPCPVALVFGHEVEGVSPAVLERCAGVVRIPMLGHKRTLNVATAFGIVLYEVLRRRGVLEGAPLGSLRG